MLQQATKYSVGLAARPSFPKTLRQFQADFATDEACQRYLAACHWPDGFVCPRCGHAKVYELLNQRRRQCGKCRYQVSLTSGTVLHRTKIPLTHWFWAAYLMTTDKRGVSALLLHRQLGVTCYQTAWMMLHKLRRAMVNLAREPLHGEVEVDETWIAREQAGLRGRQLKHRRAALVLVASLCFVPALYPRIILASTLTVFCLAIISYQRSTLRAFDAPSRPKRDHLELGVNLHQEVIGTGALSSTAIFICISAIGGDSPSPAKLLSSKVRRQAPRSEPSDYENRYNHLLPKRNGSNKRCTLGLEI